MAFVLNNNAGANARQGRDLQEILTAKLGFLNLAGDAKLKLLPSPWPADDLPPPSASLLSISSRMGLVAAAGPDCLVIASTDTVRQSFAANLPSENNVKPFTPELTIEIPRVSQVCFSSDGTYLVICAENGGGLAVYETQSFLQGKKEPAFQMATNGIPVRAVAPNPATEHEYAIAVVLSGGQLMIADLQSKNWQQGPNGQIFHDGVSCVAWSTRGRQLVAGRGDGTAAQMDFQTIKAIIPRPPKVSDGEFLSRILWLTNEEFIVVHTPVSTGNEDLAPRATYHFVSREKGTQNYLFQLLPDPCGPYGMKRAPQAQLVCRLRAFPPDLTELLIVASTASGDIGILSKSTSPLSFEPPGVVNEFAMTSLQEDSQRASLPPGNMTDTSPLGMALDLSSKDRVPRPILGDEMDYSPTPLPALMVLNNEGVLCAWWIVYHDSLRLGVPFGELEAAKGTAAAPISNPVTGASPFSGETPQNTASFASFAKPAPAFGGSAFGSAGTPAAAFGGTSALGANSSPWGPSAAAAPQATGSSFGQPAFGQPAFGQPAFGQPAFGTTTPVGSGGAFAQAGRSPWGTPSTTVAETSATAAKPSPFGGNAGAASPFASFANKGSSSPFAALGGEKKNAISSPFGAVPSSAGTRIDMNNERSSGSTVPTDSSAGGLTLVSKSAFGGGSEQFGTPAGASTSIFGQKPATSAPVPAQQEAEMGYADDQMVDEPAKSAEGEKPATLGGFKFTSSFKPDNQEDNADDERKQLKTSDQSAPSFFGDGFSKALGETTQASPPATPVKKEPGAEESRIQDVPEVSTTPATPSTVPPPEGPFMAPKPSGLPSIPESEQKTPNGSEKSTPLAGSSPEDVQVPDSPGLADDEEDGEVVDDAPLPPDQSTVKVDTDFSDQLPGHEQPLPETSPFGTPPATAKAAEALLPALSPNVPSTTPAGMPKAPLFQPPSTKSPQSPRSPSPVRSASTPARRFPSTLPPQLSIRPPVNFPQSASASQAQSPPSKQPTTPPLPSPSRQPSPERQPLPAPEPQPKEPSASDLRDQAAEDVRKLLAEPIVPSHILEPFSALQGYVSTDRKKDNFSRSTSGGEGVGKLQSQLETMYRDMNDMVDTLGLNARNLEAWIMWNAQDSGDVKKAKADLLKWGEKRLCDDGNEEHWPLGEAEDLGEIIDECGVTLDGGVVVGKREKVGDLITAYKHLNALRKRTVEIRKWIEKKKGEGSKEEEEDTPLPPDTVALRQGLSERIAEFKILLVEAEEAASMVRVKLARMEPGKVPTLEAVSRTVEKVGEMARGKSEDVDVLEMKMAKLGLVVEPENGPGLAASMSGLAIGNRPSPRSSPFAFSKTGSRASPSRGSTPWTPRTPKGSRLFDSSSVESTPMRGSMMGGRLSMNGSKVAVKVEEGEEMVALLVKRKRKMLLVRNQLLGALERRANEGAAGGNEDDTVI